jgi:uncharacterized protein (DUF1330 family)
MPLITAIDPTRTSLALFAAELADDRPVVMLNLLRFNAQASDQSGRTGREAYAEYSRLIMPLLAAVGGQPIWFGRAHCALIAPAEESWDEVLLVKYPHPQAFLQMIGSAEYLAIVHHRRAALFDSRLIATSEGA